MKSLICLLMLIPLLLKTCVNSEADNDRVLLAKVGDEAVYLDEALQSMPQGLSGKDSTQFVGQFLKSRVKDLLLYEKAVKNIPQTQEMADLVENYRRSLIIYEYQQQVLNEKMQTEISEPELLDFYKSNNRRFAADHNLVKGIFLKISKNAPDLVNLKKIYKNSSAESIEKVEKYCVQNAGQVEFFYDKWISFDDIMDKIPFSISNKSDFLRTHNTLDVVENDYCYLLYINEYVLSGNTAPFDYVHDNVRNVLINSKKSLFINQFEQNLFKEAEQKKKIKYYK